MSNLEPPPSASGLTEPASAITDPVLRKRARIAGLVDVGQKVGYGLFGAAIVAFIITKIDKPTNLLTTIIAASMAVGSLILAPAIVFGYAVKAAEREDRQRAALKAAKAAKSAKAASDSTS